MARIIDPDDQRRIRARRRHAPYVVCVAIGAKAVRIGRTGLAVRVHEGANGSIYPVVELAKRPTIDGHGFAGGPGVDVAVERLDDGMARVVARIRDPDA